MKLISPSAKSYTVVYAARVEAPARVDVLPEATAMPDWHRGLRLVTPLITRAADTWPYRTIDAAGLR